MKNIICQIAWITANIKLNLTYKKNKFNMPNDLVFYPITYIIATCRYKINHKQHVLCNYILCEILHSVYT